MLMIYYLARESLVPPSLYHLELVSFVPSCFVFKLHLEPEGERGRTGLAKSLSKSIITKEQTSLVKSGRTAAIRDERRGQAPMLPRHCATAHRHLSAHPVSR